LTPQPSPSRARTWRGWATPTSSSLTATGGLGYPAHAPYDAICITAACSDVPPPLIEQLTSQGRLVAPVLEGTRQRLTLLEKTTGAIRRTILTDVLYVSLRGRYGAGSDRTISS
jgi:protein-L-isoaspartate(D-aspartate) O-methyltransferase